MQTGFAPPCSAANSWWSPSVWPSIAPGAVETEFSLIRFKGDKERAAKVYEGFTPLFADDVADAILFAVTRPAHVNINDMLIMPAAQANMFKIHRVNPTDKI